MRGLKSENAKLKRMPAERALENGAMRDVMSKEWRSPPASGRRRDASAAQPKRAQGMRDGAHQQSNLAAP